MSSWMGIGPGSLTPTPVGACSRSGDQYPSEEALEDIRFATSLQKDHRQKSRSIIPSLAIMPIS